MTGIFFVATRFSRGLIKSFSSREFRALFLFVCMLLTSGTLFYHSVEHWSYLDSLYFSVITLATVGYGDLTPQTPFGKIFTIFYIFLGVGTLISFFTIVARNALEHDRLSRRITGSGSKSRTGSNQ